MMKCLMGACLLAMSAHSMADTFTYQLRDYSYPREMGQLDGGQSQLRMGSGDTPDIEWGMLDFFDTVKMMVMPTAYDEVTVQKDQDGFYASLLARSQLTAATLDTTTHALTGFSLQGDLTLATTPVKNATSGGSFSISNLSLDLNAGVIRGKVIGANGVGTVNDVALWSTRHGMSSSSVLVGRNTCPNLGNYGCDYFGAEGFDRIDVHVDAPDLALTDEAVGLMNQSLGLLQFGRNALDLMREHSDTGFSLVGHFEVPQGFNLTAVPEPGTWALMGLGLVGLFGLRTRRRAG